MPVLSLNVKDAERSVRGKCAAAKVQIQYPVDPTIHPGLAESVANSRFVNAFASPFPQPLQLLT